MRNWGWLVISLSVIAGIAQAADYKTLRRLNAPPAIELKALPSGSNPQPLELAKVVVEPRNGETWAIAYTSIFVRGDDDDRPEYKLMTWKSGRVEEQTAAYKRVFDEELKKAGFATDTGDSLFGDGDSSAALKVGVLIDDIQGRFCVDCPNLFNRKGIPATVVMTANWEIYSTLERRVVAKVTTSGGADYKVRLQDSFLPAVYEGFRENVRRLLANDDFRRLVTSPGREPSAPPISAAPIQFESARSPAGLSQVSKAVAVVFAADGSGSGFLVSGDGFLLTNQHVVGGSKYVKLKWSDGTEGLGEVVRTDSRRDVALVKADPKGRLPLALRTGEPAQGETVYAIGSPLGEALQNTMTKGIVSANRVDHGLAFIQSDVAVTHGNSGGPLLDEKGQVIGITDWGLGGDTGNLNLNFFIPIGDALKALGLTPAPAAPPLKAAATSPAKLAHHH